MYTGTSALNATTMFTPAGPNSGLSGRPRFEQNLKTRTSYHVSTTQKDVMQTTQMLPNSFSGFKEGQEYRDAYTFLLERYNAGDRICVLGSSSLDDNSEEAIHVSRRYNPRAIYEYRNS
jgi:hypothetical protein